VRKAAVSAIPKCYECVYTSFLYHVFTQDSQPDLNSPPRTARDYPAANANSRAPLSRARWTRPTRPHWTRPTRCPCVDVPRATRGPPPNSPPRPSRTRCCTTRPLELSKTRGERRRAERRCRYTYVGRSRRRSRRPL
jgi:hypothetical protein